MQNVIARMWSAMIRSDRVAGFLLWSWTKSTSGPSRSVSKTFSFPCRMKLIRSRPMPVSMAGCCRGTRAPSAMPRWIYRDAPVSQRRVVHGALADATDATVDPDRRAWHLASAVSGPDEDIAADLERSAARAEARGGLAAAAAFLDRAVGLTPDPARRTERALAAAQASFQAGAFDAAQRLLATA